MIFVLGVTLSIEWTPVLRAKSSAGAAEPPGGGLGPSATDIRTLPLTSAAATRYACASALPPEERSSAADAAVRERRGSEKGAVRTGTCSTARMQAQLPLFTWARSTCKMVYINTGAQGAMGCVRGCRHLCAERGL